MPHAIEDIEGIDRPLLGDLHAVGIRTSTDLLEACATPAQRAALAERLDLPPTRVLRLACRADLLRVEGLAPASSILLEHAGISSVPELAERRAAALRGRLNKVNERLRIVRDVIREADVSGWINAARHLDRALSF